jgi:hypothetical protein
MACDEAQGALDKAVASAREQTNALFAEATDRIKNKVKFSEDELENDDAVKAALTAAGMVIGGATGGAGGALVGATIGEIVGKLFIIKFEMRRVEASLDLPVVKMSQQTIFFDSPTININQQDVFFETPSVRMKTIPGPCIPQVTIEWVNEGPFGAPVPKAKHWCEPTYIEVPEVFMEQQKVSLGVPEFRMEQISIVLDLPETRMERTDISYDLPTVVVRPIAEVSEKLSSEAKRLSAESAQEISALQMSAKEILKKKITEPLGLLFDCFRENIKKVYSVRLDAAVVELKKAEDALSLMRSSGVPTSDDDYVIAEANRNKASGSLASIQSQLQGALDKLTKSQAESLEKMSSS